MIILRVKGTDVFGEDRRFLLGMLGYKRPSLTGSVFPSIIPTEREKVVKDGNTHEEDPVVTFQVIALYML